VAQSFTAPDSDLAEIGRKAALRLLDAIAGEPEPGRHAVPGRLMVREST